MPDMAVQPRAHARPIGRVAYVDGRYMRHDLASVHIEDRGLQFADAIYEVFGVFGGKIFDEEEHLDRLERSLGELELPMPMGRRARGEGGAASESVADATPGYGPMPTLDGLVPTGMGVPTTVLVVVSITVTSLLVLLAT